MHFDVLLVWYCFVCKLKIVVAIGWELRLVDKLTSSLNLPQFFIDEMAHIGGLPWYFLCYIQLFLIYTESARRYEAGDIPADQSEIIFMGTGTSEGIPRVSCLTNPLKKCEVWILTSVLK